MEGIGKTMARIVLNETTQSLEFNEYGYCDWVRHKKQEEFDGSELCLILCDVWDRHWARAFTERVERKAPFLNFVTKSARDRGIQIIHAPSDCAGYYEGTNARQKVLDLPNVPVPELNEFKPAPHPLSIEPSHMDTGEQNDVMKNVWRKIHHGIEIDYDRDLILENRIQEFWNIVSAYKFKKYIIMGGATNMCMLHREFALINQKKLGLESLFVKDASIAAYTPQCSPYVSFEEGQRLSVEYLEKFICPSILSEDFVHDWC